MSAGYSGTPLWRKLGIKKGHQVATAGAPTHFGALLDPLPACVSSPAGSTRPRALRRSRGLRSDGGRAAKSVQQGQERLHPFGGLWVAWPKRSSPLARDLKESHVRAFGLSTGLVDNKICAIDEDWSGLRFVVRVVDRPPRR